MGEEGSPTFSHGVLAIGVVAAGAALRKRHTNRTSRRAAAPSKQVAVPFLPEPEYRKTNGNRVLQFQSVGDQALSFRHVGVFGRLFRAWALRDPRAIWITSRTAVDLRDRRSSWRARVVLSSHHWHSVLGRVRQSAE